jgi:hypothetical protein
VSDNTAPNEGGGIYNNSGTATLTKSPVTNNTAASGSSIFNNTGANVTLPDSSVLVQS